MITNKTEHTSISAVNDTQTEASEENAAELLNQAPEEKPSSEPEVTREQLALGKRLLNWRTIVPLVVVIGLMIFFAQRANINPQKTWSAISSANLWLFAAAFLVYYLSFGIRALRWKLLLENVGYTSENGIHLPKFWKLVEIIYISFFANVVVPAKLGDLYRAYLLRQEINVSTTRSFGTVLAERLLDLIVLLLLFIPAIIISLHQNLPSQLLVSLEILLVAVVLGVAALFVLRLARESIAKIVPQRFRDQYYHLQEGMLGSF
ncbi:MAG TPA: lysylphosphatidylglycerol synthase transmembrane domain-containing protein, partial [Ktedonobacteraceae bacterium]|nr:lysylphosphatidylglycerol synthase transmembrane domain-containing protein [Ktedonobacteraceae bacterium]